jgi:hypothetical protein
VRLEIVRKVAGCDEKGELGCGELVLPVAKPPLEFIAAC